MGTDSQVRFLMHVTLAFKKKPEKKAGGHECVVEHLADIRILTSSTIRLPAVSQDEKV